MKMGIVNRNSFRMFFKLGKYFSKFPIKSNTTIWFLVGNKEAVKVILETSSSSMVSVLVKSLIHKRLDFIMFMLAKLASSFDSIKVYNNL